MTTVATTTPTALATWLEPEGITPRGTLIVLVGRGEHAGVYNRFGRRLAADAYRVVVVETRPAEQVAELLADPDVVRPVVLVGSDAGAVQAAALAAPAALGSEIDAVVLAGLPDRTGDRVAFEDAAAETAARTACPNHRGVLGRDAAPLFTVALDGALVAAVHALPDPLRVPVLAIHGEADPISPSDEAIAEYRRLGATEIHVVSDGLHDILNDVTHRSVAATIVLFLERLRAGAELPLLVRPVAPAA